VRGDEDHERRRQVADPAQVALARAREHERRRAERRDPQVRRRPVGDLSLTAHQHDERMRKRRDREQQHRADDQREPLRLRAEVRRVVLPPPAVQPRNLRGRAVGEEVEDRERRRHHGRGDRQRRELRRAEVPDDRGVGEHVERLGRERAERGHGEPQDLAVVSRGPEPGSTDHRGCLARIGGPRLCIACDSTIGHAP
jgi:hypothetical protein